MQQNHRLTAAVDVLIHPQPVNRRIARSQSLLPEHSAGEENRQEHEQSQGGCFLHIGHNYFSKASELCDGTQTRQTIDIMVISEHMGKG